jgi:hypothetical protein
VSTYADIKQAGSDLLALTLNGSPRWRVLVLGAILALSACVAWGYLNYARASEVGGLKKEVTDIKVALLANSILAACDAKKTSDSDRQVIYWQQHLAKLRNEYWQMTGQSFELPPSC